MTSAQLEPSAHAPCTSTTLRASAGFAARADAPAAKSVAESILMATTATVQSVFFFDPWMYFSTALRRFLIVTLLFELMHGGSRVRSATLRRSMRGGHESTELSVSGPQPHVSALRLSRSGGHQMLFGSAASEDCQSMLVFSSGER